MRLPTLKQISVATLVGTCIDWIVRVFDLWSADYKGVWKTSVDLLAPVFAAMSIDAVVVLGSLAVFLFAQFGDRIWQRLGYPPSNGWSRPEGQSMAFLVGEEKGKLLDERLGKMAYEEVARLNEHVLQQQASLDTANNNINTSFKKLEAKINELSGRSELGEKAYKAIHGFLMIRVIGYQVKHLKGYIDSVRGYLSSPTDEQIGSSYDQLNTIRFNLHSIAEYLQSNGVHGAVGLISKIRDVECQRKEQISFENSSGMSEREKYERERARLLKLLETVHLTVDRAKKHYRQLYLAPRMKED